MFLPNHTATTTTTASATTSPDCISDSEPPTAENCADRCTKLIHEGVCYAQNKDGLNWEPAKDYCVMSGGRLATAETDAIHDGLVNVGLRGWLGLQNKAGVWLWMMDNNEEVQALVARFAPSFPSGSGPYANLVLATGLLENLAGTGGSIRKSICQYKLPVTTSTEVTAVTTTSSDCLTTEAITAANCPLQCRNYIVNGSCFASTTDTYSRENGRESCAMGGGGLAVAPSDNLLNALVTAGLNGWLGLEMYAENDYRWNNGTDLLPHAHPLDQWWKTNHPSGRPFVSLNLNGDLVALPNGTATIRQALCMFPPAETSTAAPTTSPGCLPFRTAPTAENCELLCLHVVQEDRCFARHNTGGNYSHGLSLCVEGGGQLAVVSSDAALAALGGLGGGGGWVGLRQTSTGVWAWQLPGGEKRVMEVNSTWWQSPPDTSGTRLFGAYQVSEAGLFSFNETGPRASICMFLLETNTTSMSTSTMDTSTSAPNETTTPGCLAAEPTAENCERLCSHVVVGARCYARTLTERTPAGGRSLCEDGGGHLAVAFTSTTLHAISELGAGWISLMMVEGTWSWTLPDESLRTATTDVEDWWATGHPKDGTSRVLIHADGKLRSRVSAEYNFAICMFTLPSISSESCHYTRHAYRGLINNPSATELAFQAGSLAACLAFCDARPACPGVNFRDWDGRCALKNGTAMAPLTNHNRVEAYSKNDSACGASVTQSEQGCNYREYQQLGNNENGLIGQDRNSPSKAACASLCDREADCVAAVYISASTRCYMKSSLDFVDVHPLTDFPEKSFLEKVDQGCPDTTSTVPDTTSTVPDTTSTTPDTTSTVPDTTSTAPDTTSTVPATTSTVPDTTSTAPDTTSTVPATTSTVPDTTSTAPDNTSTVPAPTSTVPATTSTVHDTTPTVPDTTLTVPDTTSTVPDTTSTSPDITPTFPGTSSTVPDIASKEQSTTAWNKPDTSSSELVTPRPTAAKTDNTTASDVVSVIRESSTTPSAATELDATTRESLTAKSSGIQETTTLFKTRSSSTSVILETATGHARTTTPLSESTGGIQTSEETASTVEAIPVKSQTLPQSTRDPSSSTTWTIAADSATWASSAQQTHSASTESTSTSAQSSTAARESSSAATPTVKSTAHQQRSTTEVHEISARNYLELKFAFAIGKQSGITIYNFIIIIFPFKYLKNMQSYLQFWLNSLISVSTIKATSTYESASTKGDKISSTTELVEDKSAQASTAFELPDAKKTTTIAERTSTVPSEAQPTTEESTAKTDQDSLTSTQLIPNGDTTATTAKDNAGTTESTTTTERSATTSEPAATTVPGTTTTQIPTTTTPVPAKASTANPTSTEAPTTTTAFPFQQCRTALNVRYSGGQVISNASSSVDECCRRCQTEPKCKGFTFDVANRTCFLLGSLGKRSLEKGWLSGGTVDSPLFRGRDAAGDEGGKCLTEEHMTSYYGGDMGQRSNVSQGDCCELCFETLGCVGYSFERRDNGTGNGRCTLKRPTRQRNPVFGESFISATITAKRNVSTTAAPTTTEKPSTEPPATKAPRPRDAPPEPLPPVMDETEQVVADTIQSIGCIWIVVAAALTLAVCALFRNTSHERLIHVSQELSILLAHVIILAHRDPKFSDYNWTLCRVSALALHYLQTVTTAAFLLEAVQIYAVSTSVEMTGGFFTRRASFVLAWALPAVLTGMTAPFIYYDYVSWFSCWINLDAVGSKVVFGPIMILVAITVITWEAASSFRGQVLATDPTQKLTALVNRQGLPVVMGLYVACHATGSMAIHYQRVGIYGLVFVLNAVFGSCLFFFHALSDQRIRAAFAKILPCLKTG